MASNVVAHLDAKDNIYPRKERAENKIDGIVALIMALSRAIKPGDSVVLGSDYELMLL
jgi:phage terminase large subunit-like protein